MSLVAVLLSGYQALLEYVVAHTVTCLIPAFFIAGAIAAFVSQQSVIKYFGPQTNKMQAYGVASISGAILAVCSCTVLPLFAGIHRKGAGLGPAIAFLYSSPAINILAVTYTAQLLGFEIGLARAVGAVSFAVIIGLIMASVFRSEANAKEVSSGALAFANNPGETKDWHRLAFLILLIAILLTATSKLGDVIKGSIVAVEILMVIYAIKFWFKKEEVSLWVQQTWSLAKLIVPVLLVGVFLAGVIKALLPPVWVARFVSGNTVMGNFIASFSGALMYFATLTEVPIISTLMDLGMGKGPVLALLLAGPALSLPSILAIQRIIGTRKTVSYVFLVVVFATVTGLIFGAMA